MNRLAMIAALRTVFVPELVGRGFRGPFPHFRRTSNLHVDILTVQFNRHGGSFVLEIAQCEPNGVTTYWGKLIPPTKVRSWDINFRKRHRLRATNGNLATGSDSMTEPHFTMLPQPLFCISTKRKLGGGRLPTLPNETSRCSRFRCQAGCRS